MKACRYLLSVLRSWWGSSGGWSCCLNSAQTLPPGGPIKEQQGGRGKLKKEGSSEFKMTVLLHACIIATR